MKYSVVRYFHSSFATEVEAESAREALYKVRWELKEEELDQLMRNMDEVERNASGNGENVGIVY